MPRTKLSKNAKRNRDAAKDETLSTRLREFDLEVDQFLSDLEFKRQERLDENKSLANLVRTLPQRIHDMKMGELMAMEEKTIDEVNVALEKKAAANRSMMNASLLSSSKKKSKGDEEDSGSGNMIATSAYTGFTRGMTPSARPVGPLSSAKAKSRNRRSRSACGYLNTIGSNSSTISSSTTSSRTTTDRMSRSRMRTPLNNRVKAASADRAAPVTPKVCPNTPLSMLRYPRIGETVISLTGSPIVAQCPSDTTATVNIPIKDGVISLRPTRLDAVHPDFIESIDAETWSQIKELQSNLNKLVKSVDGKI
ncbi:unnamed protein product [Hermetia illucens]|uniref:Borealin C-terminal domain-containing protein n=1 Tax=Hermetia illucens TaxID=343691 RepID=A0A7R8UWN2_HERIL|nr:borealin-like isoform X2 [Hermetia illucens]CAD7088332.1 unnamed protein product [Hermetia illucens]